MVPVQALLAYDVAYNTETCIMLCLLIPKSHARMILTKLKILVCMVKVLFIQQTAATGTV